MSCPPTQKSSGPAPIFQEFDGDPELLFEEHLRAVQRDVCEIGEIYRRTLHAVRSLSAENDALRRSACARDGAGRAIEGRGGGPAGAGGRPALVGCCLQGVVGQAPGGKPAPGGRAGRPALRGGPEQAGTLTFGGGYTPTSRQHPAPARPSLAGAEAPPGRRPADGLGAQAQGLRRLGSEVSPRRHAVAPPQTPCAQPLGRSAAVPSERAGAQPLGKSAAAPSEPSSPGVLGRRAAEAESAGEAEPPRAAPGAQPARGEADDGVERNGKRRPTFNSKYSSETDYRMDFKTYKEDLMDGPHSPRSPGGVSMPSMAASSMESVIRSKKDGDSRDSTGDSRRCARVINPMSPRRLLWDMIGLLLICYDIVAFPLLAFGPTPWALADTMQWVSACFWLCDMPSQFFLSFPKLSGDFEKSPAETCKKYFKSWFCFDLTILLIDWGFLVYGLQEEFVSTLRSGKVLRLLKILKGMRIIRISEYLRLYDFMQDLLNSRVLVLLFRACELLVILIAINHFNCCIWYFVGDTSSGISWVSTYIATTGEPFKDLPLSYRYAVSLHWSLCQFTPASMEIYPHNEMERWFCVLAILLGMVTFSSFVSQITSSVSQIREYRQDRSQQEYNLREFITHNKLSNDLSHQMWTFLRNTRHHNRGLPEQQVRLLHELPHRLMEKIHVEMYTQVLTQHPLMEHLSAAPMIWAPQQWFVRICDTAAKQRFVRMNHDCFRRGHPGSMYFVAHGELTYTRELAAGSRLERQQSAARLSSSEPDGEAAVGISETVVRENTWISEPALWLENWRHCGLLLANVHSEMIQVDQRDFKKATDDLCAINLYREAFQRVFKEATTDLPPDDSDPIKALVQEAFREETAEAQLLWHSMGSAGSRVSWAPWTTRQSRRLKW